MKHYCLWYSGPDREILNELNMENFDVTVL